MLFMKNTPKISLTCFFEQLLLLLLRITTFTVSNDTSQFLKFVQRFNKS